MKTNPLNFSPGHSRVEKSLCHQESHFSGLKPFTRLIKTFLMCSKTGLYLLCRIHCPVLEFKTQTHLRTLTKNRNKPSALVTLLYILNTNKHHICKQTPHLSLKSFPIIYALYPFTLRLCARFVQFGPDTQKHFDKKTI